jgi:aspartate/methionine/tyrosine aminotransferase
MSNSFSKVSTSIEKSATLEINNTINELKAKGVNVIGFGMGELDFPTPEFIVESAEKALKDPANLKYSSSLGRPDLRELVAAKTSKSSNTNWGPENVCVSNGAKQSMANVFTILCDPGDEIIVPAPFWLSYREVIILAHGKPVIVNSTIESDFKVSVEQLEKAYSPKTKAVIMVSPQNPTGTVYTPEELKAIGKWARKKNIWVISDEIYEHIIFDDDTKYSTILKEVPELKDRTIILNGVAKSFAMTGWRLGWMVAPQNLIDIAQNIQSQVVSNVFDVVQIAGRTALENEYNLLGQNFLNMLKTELKKRRDAAYSILQKSDIIKSNLPRGAFYFFIDISKAMKPNETTKEFTQKLLKEKTVACVPGDGFGMKGHIRISYATAYDNVVEGLNRIVDFCENRTSK